MISNCTKGLVLAPHKRVRAVTSVAVERSRPLPIQWELFGEYSHWIRPSSSLISGRHSSTRARNCWGVFLSLVACHQFPRVWAWGPGVTSEAVAHRRVERVRLARASFALGCPVIYPAARTRESRPRRRSHLSSFRCCRRTAFASGIWASTANLISSFVGFFFIFER